MSAAASLPDRFVRNLEALGVGGEPTHVLVALSGGLDSVTLLHLLRFASGALPLTVTAAHLDHAMREASVADARWVRGLCAAWGVTLVHQRLHAPPRGEADARRARYEFLRATAETVGADFIATAHHADDQAETVLFRVLRGTGLRGLGGIRSRTASGLLRPMLPFWRREIAAYARAAGLRWRRDASNRSIEPARNRIRRRILPEVEAHVARGARRSLVVLGELAREAEAERSRALRAELRRVARREGDAIVVDRIRMRGIAPPTARAILRRLLRLLDSTPDRAGTRAALQFITDAPSGREMQLRGGVRLRTEFDEVRLGRALARTAEVAAEIDRIPDSGHREAALRLDGCDYRVLWSRGGPTPASARGGASPPWWVALDPGALHLPLRIRGRRPGDRMRTEVGTKTLRRLFNEERVPRSRRDRLPVVVDARGEVLWVAGVRRPGTAASEATETALLLTIVDD